MKEVLLLSNLDLQSEDVLRYAAQFCKYYKCKLHILHFVEGVSPILVSSSTYYRNIGLTIDSAEQEAELLRKIKNTTTEYIETDWLNVSIRDENESVFMQKFLSDHLIDLIIVGQHIFKENSDTAVQNLRHILSNITTSPMLVVPSLEIFKPFLKSNYLLQFMSEQNIKHIKHFKALFSASQLMLTHVEQTSGDKIQEWTEKKWLDYIHKNVDTEISYESLKMEYADYINRENFAITRLYGLLVFATANRNFWRRLLTPSTTLKVLTNLEMPALVFKNQAIV